MYSNFILINSDFLNQFNDNVRSKVEDKLLKILNKANIDIKDEDLKNYFRKNIKLKYSIVHCYCPKCKVRGYLKVPTKIISENNITDLKYCPCCGEPNIGYRFKIGYEKVKSVISLSNKLDFNKDKEVINTLNQQIVVMISSVLEIYLRDYYVGILNTIYVKHNRNLADRFVKDCKNDFLNPDKANERFKKELGIDIKQLISIDEFTILKEISSFRNVIVHNNGISDKAFIKSTVGKNYEERQPINISAHNLNIYFDTLLKVVTKLDLEYHNIILNNLIDEFMF